MGNNNRKVGGGGGVLAWVGYERTPLSGGPPIRMMEIDDEAWPRLQFQPTSPVENGCIFLRGPTPQIKKSLCPKPSKRVPPLT